MNILKRILPLLIALGAVPALAQNINPSTQLRFVAPPVAYSVVFTGTTATGNWNAAAGPGSVGQTLLSNGAGALPSFQSLPISSLSAQATNTILGNATSGSASPTALAIGTCSTSSSVLIWTTNSGFGCKAIAASNLSDTAANTAWSPADGSGAGLIFSGVTATYYRIGKMVFANFTLTYPSTASSSAMSIAQLPFTSINQTIPGACTIALWNGPTPISASDVNPNSSSFQVRSGATTLTNAQMSTSELRGQCVYQTS